MALNMHTSIELYQLRTLSYQFSVKLQEMHDDTYLLYIDIVC